MGSQNALAVVAARRRITDRARAAARRASAELEAAVVNAAESGASQRQIAISAGVSQPYVARVLRAHRRFRPQSNLGERLASKRDEVLRLLLSHGVDNVTVFGSVADGTDGPDSDIDLMIDIPDDIGLFALGRLEAEVSDLLGVTVDLVPRRIIRPKVAESAAKVSVRL